MAIVAPGVLAAAAVPDPDTASLCPPAERSDTGKKDYRLRDSTAELRGAYQDNWKNHMEKAVELLRVGSRSVNIMRELHWTLVKWPNHLPALQYLIEHDLRGGLTSGHPPAICYFVYAQQFAPDDVSVAVGRGVYLWKKGDKRGAEAAFQAALVMDPDSAEANYNLGLLYLELSEPSKAREHARKAYAAGWPLPGLRKKLQAAGQWREPDTAAQRD